MQKTINALIIAEACNPEWTSVPLVGWSHVEALMRHPGVEVNLVTQVRNQEALSRSGLEAGRDYTLIDSEAVIAPMYKLATMLRGGAGKGWTTLTAFGALAYPYFEYLVWKQFRERIQKGEFDVVHRITPLSPTAPSLLAKKCKSANVPFVLGPLNGGVPWPKEFEDARKQEKEWLSYVRWLYTFLPGYRTTRSCASAILVGSKATRDDMPPSQQPKCIYVPENAVDPMRFPELADCALSSEEGPLKVSFVGRLVPYKGVDMLLEAASSALRQSHMTLDIYGDGPERSKLEAMVDDLALRKAVTFHGFIEHGQLHLDLAQAHVFAFPSIREFGGGVVLEAMAVGAVPLVIDYAGPGELVNEEVGFKIAIGQRKDIIKNMRALLEALAKDRGQLREKQIKGKSRVKQLFTWDQKAEQTFQVYRWVVGWSSVKPTFNF